MKTIQIGVAPARRSFSAPDVINRVLEGNINDPVLQTVLQSVSG